MKYLTESTSTIWCINSTDIPEDPLAKTLITAFLFCMNDCEGKFAISKLLERLIVDIGLQGYQVVSTGSSSHVTRFTTAANVICIMHTSTESDSSESTPPKQKKRRQLDTTKKCTRDLSTTTDAHQPVNTDFMDSKTESHNTSLTSEPSSQTAYGSKLSLSDIIVFTQELPDCCIVAKLVVSVKSFFLQLRGMDIVKEMLSRLPYQQDLYGLELNAGEAALYKVCRTTENDVPIVLIYKYPPYSFKVHQSPFDVSSLWNMIKDVAIILLGKE